MAITIKSDPSGFVSANEDVWHVVDSTNKNVIGFKYIFDIYKGGVLLTRVINSPYGNDGYGVINVGNIVKSLVSVDSIGNLEIIDPIAGLNNRLTEGANYWWGEYGIKFGEVCGVTNIGEPNILPDLEVGNYRVYNTYNRHEVHEAGAALSTGVIFLTNRPDDSYYYDDEPVILSVNCKRFSAGTVFRINIQQNLGSVSQTVTAIDGFVYFGINRRPFFNVSVAPDTGDALATKRLVRKCTKYKTYTLVFLNAYGAWDSFSFINGNIITENEKKRFEQMEWRLNGFNMVNKNGRVKYEGMRTYGGDFKTKMKLNSEILSTEEYKWLFELVVSPLVYLWDGDNNLYHPVQITDTNYEMKNSLQNKSDFLEVNIDVYKQNTQYR
jgi:hypothetical protein